MDLHQRIPGAPEVEPSWHWPDAAATSSSHDVPLIRGAWEDEPTSTGPGATAGTAAENDRVGGGVGVGEEDDEEQAYRRRFKPRTCRICLETTEPTFDTGGDEEQHHEGEDDGGAGDGLLEAVVGPAVAASLRDGADRIAAATPPILKRFYQSPVVTFVLHPQHFLLERFRHREKRQDGHRPGNHNRRGYRRPRYVSEDPASGRLFSPCHCRGSQKYVHEGCLQAWRHAAPLADRNYWTCPTCKFSYRIERLRWARLVSGTVARAVLTLFVFLLALFLLGFVADPLIALWQDPGGLAVGALFDFLGGDDGNVGVLGAGGPVIQIIDLGGGGLRGGRVYAAPVGGGDDTSGSTGWIQHFSKGLLSLGLVGAVRTFLVSSPVAWWTVRATNGAVARNRRRGNNVSFVGWTFVLWGAFLFLKVTWKGINRVSGLVLDRASERIVDVGGNDDDDDDDVDDVNRAEDQ